MFYIPLRQGTAIGCGILVEAISRGYVSSVKELPAPPMCTPSQHILYYAGARDIQHPSARPPVPVWVDPFSSVRLNATPARSSLHQGTHMVPPLGIKACNMAPPPGLNCIKAPTQHWPTRPALQQGIHGAPPVPTRPQLYQCIPDTSAEVKRDAASATISGQRQHSLFFVDFS